MCIICAKPIGAEMPDVKTLKTCWNSNKDGAGLAFTRAGDTKVHLLKGFMKFKNLQKTLTKLNLTKDDTMVLHFRFATHGLTDGGNCHPFPLSSKISDLRAIVGDYPVAVAHNGIFGNMPAHETLSDTQKFVGAIMADEGIINNLDNKAVQELLRGYCGASSKLAIIRPQSLLTIGDFIEHKGCLYSNHGFKSYTDYIWGDQEDSCRRFSDIKPLSLGKHNCEVCGKSKHVDYDEELGVYICDYCLDWQYSRGSIYNK